MSWNPTPTAAHLIIGIATIGSAVGLAISHTISGSEALSVITGVAGVLLGTSSVSMGAASSAAQLEAAITSPPAPVVTPAPAAAPEIPPAGS